MSRKHDYAVSIGVTSIILGLFIIGGISFTYMTRPALIEAATKRVLDIRQVFEGTFWGERGKAMSGHPDKIAEHYRELAVEEVALAKAAVTNEARDCC